MRMQAEGPLTGHGSLQGGASAAQAAEAAARVVAGQGQGHCHRLQSLHHGQADELLLQISTLHAHRIPLHAQHCL